ncbi:hypothetical protein VB735_24565 [Halotia wernerae UHCC 0503]|nr:hypothetical protein [Halotia wernerae UHCC 0503]
MKIDEVSRFKVVNYSTNCLALLSYNRVLQPEREKQQKFATIPLRVELQLQRHVTSITQLNIYHNVIHQNQVVPEEKAKSFRKLFSKIQPVVQIAFFFVSWLMRQN